MYQIQDGKLVKIIPAMAEQVIEVDPKEAADHNTALLNENQALQGQINIANVLITQQQKLVSDWQTQIDANNSEIKESADTLAQLPVQMPVVDATSTQESLKS